MALLRRYTRSVKTINLSVDENTLAAAEKFAKANHTSIGDLLLNYLHEVTAAPSNNDEVRTRLIRLSNAAQGEVGPRQWTREDLYAR